MHQILRTTLRILTNITVHLWELSISLIHRRTGDKRRTERLQRQKRQTARPLRCEQVPISKINIISVWASQKSVCLCANIVIRINRGSALHEHHTIIFTKSHLGCFDLTDESIYMNECVDSQRSLLASIRIILYLCRLGNRDVWERGKKRGLVQQREGRRGTEELSRSVKAASARFTSKRLGCERDITHSDSWGQSQRTVG